MIKIAIAGAAGRMGMRLIQLAKEESQLQVTVLLERRGSALVSQELIPGIKVQSNLEKAAEQFDVLIDFTTPEATVENIKTLAKYPKYAVIGTTGLSGRQIETIKKCSETIGVVFSPNMSTGVNALFEIVRKAASLLKDYDMEILEAHHNKKKDAPSGTALKLADVIAQVKNSDLKKNAVYGRCGGNVLRDKEEIGIHALRAGDIVGEHTAVSYTHLTLPTKRIV